MKAFVKVILLKGLLQRSCEVGIIDRHFSRMQWNIVGHDVCLAFANKYVVHVPLHPIPPLGAFEKCGIDLMGPLLITPRANKFLVVAIDYFTKWAKVKPLKHPRSRKWQGLLTRGC
jgi:hypothetical protein